jgi:hypothetical protein
MKSQAKARVGEARPGSGVGQARDHVAGQAEPRVPGTRQEVELAARPTDQHVRACHVRAAGEVDADERDLAGPLHVDAAAAAQCTQVR